MTASCFEDFSFDLYYEFESQRLDRFIEENYADDEDEGDDQF